MFAFFFSEDPPEKEGRREHIHFLLQTRSTYSAIDVTIECIRNRLKQTKTHTSYNSKKTSVFFLKHSSLYELTEVCQLSFATLLLCSRDAKNRH